MKLRRPSPALVISTIALIVACTGTAFAATIITNTNQIKNGVITSADIRDGSIQGRDIKKATIADARLSPGVVKKLGGGSATGGPTTAYEAVRNAGPESQPANLNVKVLTLNVPAGAYNITAKTIMSAIVGPQDPIAGLIQQNLAIGGRCKLDAAGDADESLTNIVINQRQTPATLHMQITRTVGAPSDIELTCSAGVPFRLSETTIIAQKVSNVVVTAVTE